MTVAAISAANFQAALVSCSNAIEGGDFAAAKKYYAMAEVQNAGLLLEKTDSGQTSRRRDALTGLKSAIEVAEVAGNVSTDDQRRLISTQTRHNS